MGDIILKSTLSDLFSHVGAELHDRSGAVLYSGRAAFRDHSDIYLLGLNPGGSAIRHASDTVGQHMSEALHRTTDSWSEYLDESWEKRPPGTYGMQPRILHLMDRLGLDARRVPASNVVFIRSSREADLDNEKNELLRACWPLHDRVISALRVRTIICLGRTAGRWVREMRGAHRQIGVFEEQNARRWRSFAHQDSGGVTVATLTHPSIADWTSPSADPSEMVRALISQGRSGVLR